MANLATIFNRLTGKEAKTKEMSLTAYTERVSRAVERLNSNRGYYEEYPRPYYWAREVYADRVIISSDLKYYEAPYTIEDNEVVLAPVAEWVEVTSAWEPATLAVTKDANGNYRWFGITSSAYQDRDGEYVTKAAHTADAERMQASGEYGPLRWWHVGTPDASTKSAGVGLDLGTCDYSEVWGDFRVESGLIPDPIIGEAIQKEAHNHAFSIGFFHPANEPDTEGAFNSIHTYERSILPRGKESNLLTSVSVKGEVMPKTFDDAVAALKGLVGESGVVGLAEQLEAGTKTAQAVGLAKKEAAEGEPEGEQAPAETPAPQYLTREEVSALIAEHLKPVTDALSAQETGKAAKDNQVLDAINGLAAQVKELAGEAPRSEKRGYIASQQGDNLTDKEKQEKAAPADPFMDGLFNGLELPQAQ